MTVGPYLTPLASGILSAMDRPEKIEDGVYQVYRYLGYTIQRSDQPGYEDRWFVFEDLPPFRRWVKLPDGLLHTFGSLDEAAAWMDEHLDDVADAD